MLCCSDETKLGFVKVETATVIAAARRTIKNIQKSRSNFRREYVVEYLKSANLWWNRVWKWVGFRRPTRRDALYSFYHSETFPPSFDVSMYCARQFDNCQQLIRIAQASQRSVMWVSEEGARACNL